MRLVDREGATAINVLSLGLLGVFICAVNHDGLSPTATRIIL